MAILLYVILALAVGFFLLILIAPKSYCVERHIHINKPVSEIYTYLKNIKNQDEWSPWKKMDPGMHQEFIGTDGTVGFIAKWDSTHKNVGAGQQEITNLVENNNVETKITFLRPFKSQSDAYQTVTKDGQSTKVTWGFKGNHKPPMNVMMLLYNMDKAVGKDFETGLADLKILMEKDKSK